jgi:hypothetical protein
MSETPYKPVSERSTPGAVERMARAMIEFQEDWDDADEGDKDVYRKMARAAYEALEGMGPVKEWRVVVQYHRGRHDGTGPRRSDEVYDNAEAACEVAIMWRRSALVSDVELFVRDARPWREARLERCDFCGLYLSDGAEDAGAHLAERHPDVLAYRNAR